MHIVRDSEKMRKGWGMKEYIQYTKELERELERRQLRGSRQRKQLHILNQKLERLYLIEHVNELTRLLKELNKNNPLMKTLGDLHMKTPIDPAVKTATPDLTGWVDKQLRQMNS